MIAPVSQQEAKTFWERLQSPMERVEVFPEPDAYGVWVEKIGGFISAKGGASVISVEEYCADHRFFTANHEEQLALLFLTNLVPIELVFFGSDWTISVSSYPEQEYSSTLEWSIRLYGSARLEIEN